MAWGWPYIHSSERYTGAPAESSAGAPVVFGQDSSSDANDPIGTGPVGW